MNAADLVHRLGLNETDVLNIYQFGSRVYECKQDYSSSDWDFIIVVNDSLKLPDITQHEETSTGFSHFEEESKYSKDPTGSAIIHYHSESVDATIFREFSFLNAINYFYIPAIESLSLQTIPHIKSKYVWKLTIDYKIPDINLAHNKSLLRRSFSAVSDNSFVKCRKKITLHPEQEYVGRKSLWHSLRILLFGCQVAEHNQIINFQEANALYKDIVVDEIPCDDLVFSSVPPPDNCTSWEQRAVWKWEQYKKKYTVMKNQLKSRFKSLAPIVK
ncbi:hypothetical protein AKO1_011433 [Acrasis kona]|uniref:Nucleotidyltransferase n=1 Tax=Acrasis kona TaxID=1008807 RepID=A0AAW2Z2P7_9EUKA